MNQAEYLAKVLGMVEDSIKKLPPEKPKSIPFKMTNIDDHFPEPKWIEGGRNHSCYRPGGY